MGSICRSTWQLRNIVMWSHGEGIVWISSRAPYSKIPGLVFIWSKSFNAKASWGDSWVSPSDSWWLGKLEGSQGVNVRTKHQPGLGGWIEAGKEHKIWSPFSPLSSCMFFSKLFHLLGNFLTSLEPHFDIDSKTNILQLTSLAGEIACESRASFGCDLNSRSTVCPVWPWMV